jgi:hypothetical protein
MDGGVSPLLKGNGMEVDEDVVEISSNLPSRDTSNKWKIAKPNKISLEDLQYSYWVFTQAITLVLLYGEI